MTAMGDRVLKRTRCLKIGLIICLIGMWGCERPQKVSVVAQVENRYLTKEALERRIPTPFAGKISPKEKQRLVENWIEEEILYREAIRQNLDQDPELSDRIDRAVRQLLASELMARTHARDAEVLEDEILNYYEEHQTDFERNQLELRVRHLVVADRNAMTRAWNRLQRGEFFEQVTREVSIDQSAVNGGDLGYFTEDMVGPAFWSVCRDAKLGHRIRTRTELGYHIIEVMDRNDEGSIRDLVDVRGEIQQRILTERRREQRAKLLTELKERIEWSVDWKQLNSAK
ncbi:MAG: peptidylprolyl isomerase [Candidatus Latescibacteria bacterium]|nr:peptidylprolyl isomerase [Candidatus Latescibacterota bacterium]